MCLGVCVCLWRPYVSGPFRSAAILANGTLLVVDETQRHKKSYTKLWTTLPGVLVLAGSAGSSSDIAVQKIRTQFFRFMSYECNKLFNYNMSGICRANTQMSPEQYAAATSRIEERIQKPLLLVEGLRAELAGKKELAEELQSAEVLNAEMNAEMVEAAASQNSRLALAVDDAVQNSKRLQGNQKMAIKQLKAQMNEDAIHYKAVTSDYNRVKLPASVVALAEVPQELECFAALDMKTCGKKLSIPYLASQLFSMEVPTHAYEWNVLQTSMCNQIKPRLQNVFPEWNGKNTTWPKNWKNQSDAENDGEDDGVAPRVERPRKFLCTFAALAKPFKDLWESLSLQKEVPNPAPEAEDEAKEVCDSDAEPAAEQEAEASAVPPATSARHSKKVKRHATGDVDAGARKKQKKGGNNDCKRKHRNRNNKRDM